MAVGLAVPAARSGSSATASSGAGPRSTCAHPLDDGSAGVMLRSIEETAEGLGDGRRGLAARVRRARRAPSTSSTRTSSARSSTCRAHPLRLVRFGLPRGAAGDACSRAPGRPPQARALFGGVAAHAFSPLNRPMSSSVGMALICACHALRLAGRARAARGSITDALAAALARARRHGSRPACACARSPSCRTPTRSSSTSRPARVAEIAGDRLPARGRARLPPLPPRPGRLQGRPRGRGRRAVDERGLPARGHRPRGRRVRGDRRAPSATSTAAACPSARSCWSRQQYLADPERSAGDVHPVWAYAHVPNGYDGDATEAVIGQIERFAPGPARADRRHRRCARPAEIEADNANYVGGDIITGANSPVQVLIRPRPPSTPTPRASPASSSARPPRRPAPACTA